MTCESTISNTSIVTWLIVLGGWIVVHSATLARERRKEKRDAANTLIEAIKAVEQFAVCFHTAEKYDSSASDALIWRVSRLIRILQRPPLKAMDIPLNLMVRFRKGITLKNIDPSSFTTQTYHSDLIRDIRNATDEMIESIEAARDVCFF